jgi:hypothetical protein
MSLISAGSISLDSTFNTVLIVDYFVALIAPTTPIYNMKEK